jgi:hypothetical protein
MNKLMENFSGYESNTVFCMWTGNNPMSANRIQALWSIFANVGCPIAFVNDTNLKSWIHPDYPLHPAYNYLSNTHKSDYLRCYFMHHYGGGYTDVKLTQGNWSNFFIKIKHSNKLALGYQEVPYGIPHLEGDLGDEIRVNHKSVIGLCSFIFKPNSIITNEWMVNTNNLLDSKLEELIINPALHPQDQTNVILPDGNVSRYPLRWAELLGEIYHPIIYKHRDKLIQDSIAPQFFNYR